MKSKNHKNKEKAPFIVYADLERVLKPVNEKEKLQEYVPAAIGFYLKCSYVDSQSFYKAYRKSDSTQWFADESNHLAEDEEPGYDAHFIIIDIATRMGGSITLLPIYKEKYISFTKKINGKSIQFRFIDSFRFLALSLDKLSSYLTEFPNLTSQFTELNGEQLELLKRKGIMPYDYIDSFDRFNESVLPPIESFLNKLEDRLCPRRLYKRA